MSLDRVKEDVSEQLRTNYMGFVSFSILVWDIIDTFGDEVEYIWKGQKGPLVYLFFLNRYLTPFGFIVNLYAYLSTVWTPETCQKFIRYEGSMTIIGIEVVGLMMLLRIHAMYYDRKWVVGAVGFILFGETCANAWLMTKGVAVAHVQGSGVRACTMIFAPHWSIPATASSWIPLLYDTIVLALTLWRTLPSLKGNKNTGHIFRVLLRDGLLYYSVIFCVTFVLTIMIASAPDGLKNITAQLELLITVTMMSRITLSLKKSAAEALVVNVDTTPPGARRLRQHRHSGHSSMSHEIPRLSFRAGQPPHSLQQLGQFDSVISISPANPPDNGHRPSTSESNDSVYTGHFSKESKDSEWGGDVPHPSGLEEREGERDVESQWYEN